eukprot:gnl/TRDRNA2_/TRDRNA2_143421_c0_seq1.p1 gnl/TRDRNA2_/TRDRNA2_143421_c0~~gnl/TRDRNA2_/TRDRNA2_143421_c0_seq1.p1  ORF type:complete len:264 (-),score=23.16 gnl/TRDRNA2_/TRDRNA2_143421_c0_seq1:135-839(-)
MTALVKNETNSTRQELKFWKSNRYYEAANPYLPTTTPGPNDSKDANAEMIVTFGVSAVSLLLGLLPAFVLIVLFQRPIHRHIVPEFQKRTIVRSWVRRRVLGFFLAVSFLGFCYFYLWQFASNQERALRDSFTKCCLYNMAWKIVLRPLVGVTLIFILVSVVRATRYLDFLLDHLPISWLNFCCFTALSPDDWLLQEAALQGLDKFADIDVDDIEDVGDYGVNGNAGAHSAHVF